MSEVQASNTTGRIRDLSESARNTMALGIWLVVFVGLLFASLRGQSPLMAAGFIFQLTGAYSTFLLCGKSNSRPLVNGVPYAFVLAGMLLLWLAPDFPAPVAASLMLLAVTALMHWFVISDMRKALLGTEGTALASECAT